MSNDVGAPTAGSGGMMAHLPLWGPLLLLVILVPVLRGGDAATAVPVASQDAHAPAAAMAPAVTDALEVESIAPAAPVAAPAPVAAVAPPAAAPAWPPAPQLPAAAQGYHNPWALVQPGAQGNVYSQYGVAPADMQRMLTAPAAAQGGATAAYGNSGPYVPCPPPHYWCVPALPGAIPGQ